MSSSSARLVGSLLDSLDAPGVVPEESPWKQTSSSREGMKWEASMSGRESYSSPKDSAEFSVEELLQTLSKDSTPQHGTPRSEQTPQDVINSYKSNSSSKQSNGVTSQLLSISGPAPHALHNSLQSAGRETANELKVPETTAGAAWDIEGLLGLRGTLQQLPSNSSPTNSEKVAKGAVDSANRGAATPPAATAAATTAATAVATAAEPAEAAEGIHQKARQDNAESLAEANIRAAQLEAEQQKLKHELLLLRRRQQVAASALRAQHDAKVAAAKAAWEAERRKLVYKNQTLQATVDQTLACYEEDVRLLGEVRGSVLQAQEQQQQEQQKLLQQQLQHALQAERDHWSARLKAIQDEWSRKLEDERRQAQTRLHQAQQNRDGPAWHELHELVVESRRHSQEFKMLLLSLQQQQQQQKEPGKDKPCGACGGAVNMEDAVVALQEQQQALQEQQQALLLLAKETAKQREETEHRTRTISARLAAESLQLQSLHRSLLASRQQQQQLQQQHQQQLQQQHDILEQQLQALVQRQLQAENEAATRQLGLEQREREIERREGRLAGAAALQEKQHKARREYLQTAEAHLLKLQSELQKERQELTETALALEEKRRAMRHCYEEMETQRLAMEGRAAAAAAEAQSAAAAAAEARTLQQEGIKAKEALYQLHRQAKDAKKKQHEQQEVINTLVKEVESSRLELLRLQQQSGHLYVRHSTHTLLPCSSLCSTAPGAEQKLRRLFTPASSTQALMDCNQHSSCQTSRSCHPFRESLEGSPTRRGRNQPSKLFLTQQYFRNDGSLHEAFQSLSRTSAILTQRTEAAHERLWNLRRSFSEHQQRHQSLNAFHGRLSHSTSIPFTQQATLPLTHQQSEQREQAKSRDAFIPEEQDATGTVEATCASLASLDEAFPSANLKCIFSSRAT